MKKVIYSLILCLIISCSGENVSNVKTSDENSGLSNLLDSANKEISSLGESATEKDGLIDRITQELSSSNNSLDILNNSLEALKLQNVDLNHKNVNLSDEIEKLINTYQIGQVIDNFSVDSLTHCIEELILNKELLERMKENCKKAAKKENWENEILALHKIYSH